MTLSRTRMALTEADWLHKSSQDWGQGSACPKTAATLRSPRQLLLRCSTSCIHAAVLRCSRRLFQTPFYLPHPCSRHLALRATFSFMPFGYAGGEGVVFLTSWANSVPFDSGPIDHY